MGGPVTATTNVTAARYVQAPAGSSPPDGAPLLPTPAPVPLDSMAMLYKFLADENCNDTKSAKQDAAQKADERKKALDDLHAALEAAEKAAQEKHGFFDSIGLGGLVGIATANPILVMADMSMHMAKVTPDFIRHFEEKNQDLIAGATKVYAGMSNAAALLEGHNMTAALALGGLVVQETKVFGKDASDWAGTTMLLAGTTDRASAFVSVAADKHTAVASSVRKLEDETRDYTKWAAMAGMAVAGVGTIIASGGTATAVVVGIGLALSTSGFLVNETHCLDKLVGSEAAMWIGAGLMAGGAVMSGVGAATAAGTSATSLARSLSVGGSVLEGTAEYRQGAERVQDAVVEFEVEAHNNDGKEAEMRAEKMLRMLNDILDVAEGLKDDLTKGRELVVGMMNTKDETQLTAARMKV
jgi:hypothetical protein